MMQLLAKQHSELWAATHAITKGPNVRDGNPRAQAKMEAKVRKLGVLTTYLIPGKRGRYTLHIYSLAGWDPQRDDLIEPGDPIPKKPWICALYRVVHGQGQGWVNYRSYTALFITAPLSFAFGPALGRMHRGRPVRSNQEDHPSGARVSRRDWRH
jgi:hypothetical protein